MLLPGFAVLSQAGLTSLQSYLFLFSQCCIQFLHGFTSPHHVAVVPVLSRNSRACKGCCDPAITSSKTPWLSPLEGKDMAVFHFQLVTLICSPSPEPLGLGRFLLASSLSLMGHPRGLLRKVVPIIRSWGITSKAVAFK